VLAGGLSAALLAVPAPVTRCVVEDPRLAELSGLAADDGGLWAMADGGRQVQVHRLDPDGCSVLDTRTGDIDPVDPEDLARGPDGTLWVGDTGDNRVRRDTVAVVELPADGPARLHRLSYPDGPHDAEALLVDAQRRPIVVVKDASRPAGVYRPERAPDGIGPTPLVKVGEVALPLSDTRGGPLGVLGSRVVTGAAASADGRVVALRTYVDAWLFPVPDGDMAAALLGRPVRVPLPDEPQGEAIAFDPSGALISGSETRGGVPGEIRVVPGAAAAVAGGPGAPGIGTGEPGSGGTGPSPAGSAEPGGSGAAAGDADRSEPMPEWWPAAVGAGTLAGVLLLVALVLALRAARRRG
jgi:hypothetical protein